MGRRWCVSVMGGRKRWNGGAGGRESGLQRGRVESGIKPAESTHRAPKSRSQQPQPQQLQHAWRNEPSAVRRLEGSTATIGGDHGGSTWSAKGVSRYSTARGPSQRKGRYALQGRNKGTLHSDWKEEKAGTYIQSLQPMHTINYNCHTRKKGGQRKKNKSQIYCLHGVTCVRDFFFASVSQDCILWKYKSAMNCQLSTPLMLVFAASFDGEYCYTFYLHSQFPTLGIVTLRTNYYV